MRCSGSVHTWAALLQRILPRPCTPATTTACQPAAVSEVPRDEPTIATGSAITGSVAGESGCARRIRSGFRFNLFAAQYCSKGIEISQYRRQQSLGNPSCVHAGVAGVAEGVGRTASTLSSLCRVRAKWSFRRSVCQNPKVLGWRR